MRRGRGPGRRAVSDGFWEFMKKRVDNRLAPNALPKLPVFAQFGKVVDAKPLVITARAVAAIVNEHGLSLRGQFWVVHLGHDHDLAFDLVLVGQMKQPLARQPVLPSSTHRRPRVFDGDVR